MQLAEFKAWFEGYTEGLEAAPTKAQFDRIKEKVKEIDGKPITQTIYLRDYWHPPYYYDRYRYYIIHPNDVGGMSPTMGSLSGVATGGSLGTAGNATASAAGFNSVHAMYALGKAESMN